MAKKYNIMNESQVIDLDDAFFYLLNYVMLISFFFFFYLVELNFPLHFDFAHSKKILKWQPNSA